MTPGALHPILADLRSWRICVSGCEGTKNFGGGFLVKNLETAFQAANSSTTAFMCILIGRSKGRS